MATTRLFHRSMRVVIDNGLSAYEFSFPGRADVASIKAAISGVLPVQPCEMTLYHRGHPLTNDAQDLRVLYTSTELRLRLVVTIFVPK